MRKNKEDKRNYRDRNKRELRRNKKKSIERKRKRELRKNKSLSELRKKKDLESKSMKKRKD